MTDSYLFDHESAFGLKYKSSNDRYSFCPTIRNEW